MRRRRIDWLWASGEPNRYVRVVFRSESWDTTDDGVPVLTAEVRAYDPEVSMLTRFVDGSDAWVVFGVEGDYTRVGYVTVQMRRATDRASGVGLVKGRAFSDGFSDGFS